MKRKFIAIILSALVVPGAGQLYCRRYVRGFLFIAASVGLIAALMYKTWESATAAVSGLPPEELAESLMPIAHAVAENNHGFYNTVTLLFTIIWLAGIIDAWFSGSENTAVSKKGLR